MINRTILVGRLTKDPEVKYTQSNIPFARFTLAVTELLLDLLEKEKLILSNVLYGENKLKISLGLLEKEV